MREKQPECVQCRRPMDRGYLVDHGYGTVYPLAWAAGFPKWSRWLGLTLKKKDKVPVATFRCPRCGRLDSFAESGEWPPRQS